MDNLTPNIPNLIKLSEAARLLGYQSSAPIKKLIADNRLKSYKLPDTTRIMIDREELNSLLTVNNPKSSKETKKSA